jgi:BirA family biotin operon repressor/biotin-[acetyl-CoA-carboxylase] ligase
LEVLLGDQVITGVHRGIAEDGALLLATAEGIRSFHGGEVSVRTTAGTEAP